MLIHLYFVSSLLSASTSKEIVLERGQTKIMSVPSLSSIYVEKKSILRVSDQGNHIRVTGKKIGESTLQVGVRKYQIHILGQESYFTWQILKKWLKDKRGLKLLIKKKKVTLSGEFLTLKDFIELGQMNSKLDYLNQAKVPTHLQAQAKNWIKKKLKNNNLSAANIGFSPHANISLSKGQRIKDFRLSLSSLGIEIKIQETAISLAPMVQIKVMVAQVKKSFFRHWGISWPDQVQAQVLGEEQITPNINLTAHTLEQQGWGKILASPTLVTQSGKEAHFHSGGEFPIKSFNQFSQQVAWKTYGIFLKILPHVDQRKQIRIDIKNEISMMDHSQMVDGVPSLIKDEFQSVLNLAFPRPILISGLIKKEWGKSHNGLPLLSQIPIFRHLFSDESERDTETELVFIVSPQVLEP